LDSKPESSALGRGTASPRITPLLAFRNMLVVEARMAAWEVFMASDLPLGKFTCEFTLEVVRPPALEREERDGVTYLVGRNYELAYRTTLHFESGGEFPIMAVLIGDPDRRAGIRDHSGKPTRIS